ncbi:MAG: trigger factor [Atopobiaceae bacterium]|nr:trigger factor [Atopobiaceae bacterium]MCH4119604.1 trigger factor [Atopobiaceae bacterium]MCI1318029.1 trigger factor [Atopobiaceae bacterium]MCI1389639.1 trigger factor [Atopobiaceae bacterium]MCI1431575.1 trigger factor [Atopobiaceae bacterium]
MNIQVSSEKTADDKLTCKVVVPAAEVDKAVKDTYADIATRYRFQGFRKGHVPRPVIDGMVGRQAVLSDATNTVLNALDPQLVEELDVVPLAEVSYGDDIQPVVEHADYEVEATITVRPDAELTDYDAVAIDMPPAEPTEAEIDEQIDVLQGYHTTYEDVEEDRPVEGDDIVSIDIENVKDAENFVGKDRLIDMSREGMPAAFDSQLLGMRKGEDREVTWEETHGEGDEAKTVSRTAKVHLNAIKRAVTPELTEEFVKKSYGFDTLDELRDAVRDELKNDRTYTMPNIKENRVVEAVAKKLALDEIPESYLNSVYTDLVQTFLGQLQRQGTTLDNYLRMNGVSTEQFLDDIKEQASERARQTLALDSLADHLAFEITDEELQKEFADAGMDDAEASIKEFRDSGRLPAVREAMKRTKALNWLVENAEVTEVDEAAKRQEEKAAEGEGAEKAADDPAADDAAASEAGPAADDAATEAAPEA